MSSKRFGTLALDNAPVSSLTPAFQHIAGPNCGLGTLLNKIIAKVNSTVDETAAKATVTLGGTVNTGDTVTVTVGGKAVAFEVTASEDTLAKAATKVAEAINGNEAASALVTASASQAVVTLTAKHKGSDFNSTTLTAAVTGEGATTTATAQAATFGAATPGTGLSDIALIEEGDGIY